MKKILISIIFIWVVFIGLYSTTYYVGPNEQYTTISEALSVANNDDVVIVRDGVYNENFIMGDVWYGDADDYNVTLKSEHGADFCTINLQDSNIQFYHGTIDGFRFEKTCSDDDMFGVMVIGTSDGNPPILKNSLFKDIPYFGGYFEQVIYAQADYTISNCKFINIDKIAIYHEGYVGSGPDSHVHINSCLFDNITHDAFSPATYDYLYLDFRNNTITNCNTGLSFEGNNQTHVYITNCIFTNNNYGVYRYQGSNQIFITYSDFYNNTHDVSGCDIGDNCIFDNPQLTPHVFYLKTGSPCIGSGENGVDMGWKGYEEEDKPFKSGWNWVSFPRLLRWGNDGQNSIEVMQPLDPHGIQVRNYGATMQYNSNQWDNSLIPNFFSSTGYKIQLNDDASDYNYETYGERLSENYKIPHIQKGEYYWLGYWIPLTQNMDDAFGEFWDKVDEVKAQYWTYKDMTSDRGDGDPQPIPSMKMRPLEYGKLYIVKFKEDIDNFHWTNSGNQRAPFVKEDTQEFKPEEKADYQVLDIMDIPQDVQEIGVFLGDECIGATKVNDTAEQVLLYPSDSKNDLPISIHIYSGRSNGEKTQNYLCMNFDTGEYENTELYLDKNHYHLISLKGDNNVNEITGNIRIVNYPNPFNPTTNISFNLKRDDKITLSIYNLKGEHIATLINGKCVKGINNTVWNGKDKNNKKVGSGIYFIKLKTSNTVKTKKIIMLK